MCLSWPLYPLRIAPPMRQMNWDSCLLVTWAAYLLFTCLWREHCEQPVPEREPCFSPASLPLSTPREHPFSQGAVPAWRGRGQQLVPPRTSAARSRLPVRSRKLGLWQGRLPLHALRLSGGGFRETHVALRKSVPTLPQLRPLVTSVSTYLLSFSYGFLKILTYTKFICVILYTLQLNIRYRNFMGSEKPQRRKKIPVPQFWDNHCSQFDVFVSNISWAYNYIFFFTKMGSFCTQCFIALLLSFNIVL